MRVDRAPVWKEKPIDRFYMIWVEGKASPRVSHLDEEGVIQEAERLALLPDNIGRKVFILEATSYCEVQPLPIKWTIIP